MQTKNLSKSNTRHAETLIWILLAVVIVVLLVVVVIPNFVKPRAVASKNSCLSNLKQIDSARIQWWVENKKLATDVPEKSEIYGQTLYMRAEPPCPEGGTYSLNALSLNPTCSLSKTRESHRLEPLESRATVSSCIAILNQIETGKQQWAVENQKLATDVPADSDLYGSTLFIRFKPICPQGGSYRLNAVSAKPTCSKSGAPDFHTL